MINIFQLGLLVVIAGWLVQFAYILKGDKKIQPIFVAIYALGAVLISLGNGWNIFQLGTLTASLLVLLALIAKK